MSDPGICIFCDAMMLHCYECDESYCETLDCIANDEMHDWMKCRRGAEPASSTATDSEHKKSLLEKLGGSEDGKA